MGKAIKKPIEVEYVEWTGENHRDMYDFLTDTTNQNMTTTHPNFMIEHNKSGTVLNILTKEGVMVANIGDYIIKEPFATDDRKFYPCKPDIFHKTYNIIEEEVKGESNYECSKCEKESKFYFPVCNICFDNIVE